MVMREIETLIMELDELAKVSWINLENSTDSFLAQNYGLVVTVDDLLDVLSKYRGEMELADAEEIAETILPVVERAIQQYGF